MSLIWSYFNQILAKMYLGGLFTRGFKIRPINRIPSDNWPPTTLVSGVAGGILIAVYSAIFMLAWNFSFPSRAQHMLWRAASLLTLIYGIVGHVTAGFFHHILLPNRKVRGLPSTAGKQRTSASLKGFDWVSTRAEEVAAHLRNNSPDSDPAMEVPLRMLVPVTILCALYSISRASILIEDVLALRSLPSSLFETVGWSQYLPHL